MTGTRRAVDICSTNGTTMQSTTTTHSAIQRGAMKREATAPRLTKKTTRSASSKRLKYRSARESLASALSAWRPSRVRRISAAAATLRLEARNKAPSAQVSLQMGWLLTLSSTPV